ncbi:MAG: ketosteroid isomerase-related protein [Hyphomicrobiaceae bacterium]
MTRAATEKLIARYYDAFNAGDIDGMIDCLAPTFVHDVNQGGRRKGKTQFREFCEHMSRCYKETLKDVVVMASKDGDRAAAEFVVNGKYLATDEGLPPASGQKYKLPGGAFFTVKDGKIARVSTYYNMKDWMAQVAG